MTRRPAPNEWPEAATALLRRLWITGASGGKIAAEIARETGFRPTANAVIGKVHRLGLPSRKSPIKRGKPTRLPRKPSDISVTKTRDPRRLDTAPQAGRETDRRAELPARPEAASAPVLRPGSECQWLTGERPDWVKCGKPCEHGFDWCPEHRARVYTGGTANGGQRGLSKKSFHNGAPQYDSRSTKGTKRPRFNRRTDAKWGSE